MNTPSPQPARSRRAVFVLQAIILVFSITTCCALIGFLGAAAKTRLDVTATNTHQLAPRSRSALERLKDPIELVVSTHLGNLDPTTNQRLTDVLDAFSHATGPAAGKLSVRLIDVGTAKGQESFTALLKDLASRDTDALTTYIATVRSAAQHASQVATQLDDFAARLDPLRDALISGSVPLSGPAADQVRQSFANSSSALRTVADNVRKASSTATEALDKPTPPLPVPRADLASDQLTAPLSDAAKALNQLATTLDQLAGVGTSVSVSAKEQAAALASLAAPLRDKTARTLLALQDLPRLRIFSVAKAVQQSEAALLIGAQQAPTPGKPTPATPTPPSVVAIDLTDLLTVTAGDVNQNGAIDLRFRVEELIASGLAAFSPDPKPLVVFVHAESRPWAPSYRIIRGLVDRLAQRNIEIAEWPAGTSDQPPQAIADARAATPPRPVVFVTLPPEVSSPEAAVRMGRMANTLESLAQQGESILASVNPSALPTAGTPDPLTQWLEPYGLTADSGRPLMEEFKTAAGRNVSWDQYVTDPLADHPLASAIRGLRTRLFWPIPLRINSAVTDYTVTPIITLPTKPERWAESEWQRLRQNTGQTAFAMPSLDSPRDDRGGPGPWLLAAAITKNATTPQSTPQRLVVVGSNLWFLEMMTGRETVVEGRIVFDCPGNLELAEAAIWWLAGRDDLILRSASAAASPTIPPLTDGQLSALRWGIIAVLPLGVLLLGALWRLARR